MTDALIADPRPRHVADLPLLAAEEVLKVLGPFGGDAARVVDVGPSDGHLLVQFLWRFPNIHASTIQSRRAAGRPSAAAS